MVTTTKEARSPQGDLAFSKIISPKNIAFTILKYIGLMVLDAFALILVYAFFYDGAGGLALTIAIITIMANVFVLVPSLYPLKWMTPGLMLATLLVIYPIILTVQTAFTNYGDGNLLVKDRVIDLIRERGYVPDSATTYKWVPFTASETEYALWLIDESGQSLFVLPGQAPVMVDQSALGYSEASSRYLFNPTTAELFDSVSKTTYEDVQVYTDGTTYGLWVFKDNDRNVLYAFPNLPIDEVVFFQGRNLPSLGEGLDITYPNGEKIPATIGSFTRVENPADQVEALASLTLGVEGGDQLIVGDSKSIVPTIAGYTSLENWDSLVEKEHIEYDAPLGNVVFESLDLTTRYIYDPQQSLINDQFSNGSGIDAYYDVTVYSNGSEYALWLIRMGADDPGQAYLALPNQSVKQLTYKDNRGQIVEEMQDSYGIVLAPSDKGIPQSIGEFTRSNDIPSDTTLVWGGESGDSVKVGVVDTTNRFVVDLEQRIALDRAYGYVFSSVEFYAKDDDANLIALWLGNGNNPKRPAAAQFAAYIAIPNQMVLVNNPSRVRPSGYIPAQYEGYSQLISDSERIAGTTFLQTVSYDYFGEAGDTLGVKNTETVGRPYLLRYEYNAETETFTDILENVAYTADDVCETPEITTATDEIVSATEPICGFFRRTDTTTVFSNNKSCADQQECLTPGYRLPIGTHNFSRLVTDQRLRGPLVDIFVWTVVFAAGSVLTTFSLGLFMALILNDPVIPARKLIRSLLIIPYCIPGVISILVWQGMLNQNYGIINSILNWLAGSPETPIAINWLNHAIVSKIAVLLVNLWLGYPYMMLISSGALQSIPSEVYEAAAVDGANPQQRFWQITLPLLLVTLGPLLIGSFVYNFNNYMLIAALTNGNPPIEGSPVPAGYTDILISYTYRMAFGNQSGADYGYASAITIVIFLLVAVATLIQYRYTKTWEQVGENV
jgi:ABC-type sugar transport system permease subunit